MSNCQGDGSLVDFTTIEKEATEENAAHIFLELKPIKKVRIRMEYTSYDRHLEWIYPSTFGRVCVGWSLWRRAMR
jgi:hypothetical protein